MWKDAGEGKIEVYCDKYGVKGGQPKPVVISRYIPICELLFEGFGLWAGDGRKRRYLDHYSVFGFANTEIELHKGFLKFAALLGLSPNDFMVRVSVPTILEKELSSEEAAVSKGLGVDKSRFFKGSVNETRNYTFVDLIIQSRILGYIVKIIYDKAIEIAFSKTEFVAAFIRGLIACEANVHVRSDKSNQLGEILIAIEDKEERVLVRRFLYKLNIDPSEDKIITHQGSVLIHGRTNFEKVAYWKLCDLHPKKKERFYFGMGNFKSFQYRKGEAKKLILRSLAGGVSKNAKELAEELKINIGTIKSEHLFKLVKGGFLMQSKPTKIGRVYVKFYSLTENGIKAAEENKNIY
ncbi:MAG: hypothetical protein HY516_00835 [Candidatus Aenigmarchaeota archaeon]|nr:hypothetical protein [Candidatus Aenigmarchaeota archaeon]